MEVLQPLMLWGAGAVLIPVVIHFWHQKKGQTLAWAATRWLQEKDQQQQRGIKLDNILLLILRCLLVVLIAFLLSQPVLKRFVDSPPVQKIHLVEPDQLLVDNFRFELEDAIRKGETVYWATSRTEPASDLNALPGERLGTSTTLQTSIHALLKDRTELNLYVLNDQRLARAPFIEVPAGYKLHLLADSNRQSVRNYLDASGGRKLFVNRANRLTVSQELDKMVRFQSAPAHNGPIRTLVSFRNAAEQQTVKAALRALSEVYAFDFLLDETPNPSSNYDWILTDREAEPIRPNRLYVVSRTLKTPTVSNVIYTGEPLTPQTAEMVKAGQLPEWLGELLIRHFTLKTDSFPLTQEQLKALFVTTAKPDVKQPEAIRNGLFLLFVVLVGLERWMALRKNA